MAQLDESVVTGQIGHLADHAQIHKQLNNRFDVVADYDASGDGTDDTTPVQAAIDAAEVAGGVVTFPPGTFSGNWVVNSDKVLLHGSGKATTLLSEDGTNAIVTFENVDYCGMRDFFIDGEWTSGVEGVVLDGCRWSIFENIIGDRWTDPMFDLRADLNATQNTNDNTFIHCHAENAIRFIRFSGNAGFTQFVTLNQFFNVSAVGAGTVLSTLIDFARSADNNHFVGLTRLALGFAGSIGVVMNSDSPAAIRAVYENHFDDLVIDQEVVSTISLDINDCRVTGSGPHFSRIKYRAGGSQPTVPDIAANGFVTWLASRPLIEVSAATTLDLDNGVVNVDTSGGGVTITLPDNADASWKNYLIRRDGANTVTINRAGSDTFDDADVQKTLDTDSASINIFSIGDSEWKIVGTEGTVGGS